MNPSAEPHVSVVVAAHNAAGVIDFLMDAFERQTLPHDEFELVVVDDGSTDQTAQIVRARKWPRLVSTPGNLGAPAARNIGIRQARGSLIAFTDDDCVPDADWLERGAARFERDPGLGLLAGEVTVSLTAAASTAALIDTVRFFDQQAYAVAGFSIAAAMWCRRPLLDAVGGFNEDLAKLGHQDYELGKLLTSNGASLSYAPEVHTVHPPRDTFRALAKKAYRLGRGNSRLRRYTRSVAPRYPLFVQPRSLRPHGTLDRLGRLRRRGIEVGSSQRAKMLAGEIAFVCLPRIAGDAVGTVIGWVERLRGHHSS